jgi:hypothetical protein
MVLGSWTADAFESNRKHAVVNALLACISAPRLAVVNSDPVQAKAFGIASLLPYCDSNERRVIAVADREGVDCSLES